MSSSVPPRAKTRHIWPFHHVAQDASFWRASLPTTQPFVNVDQAAESIQLLIKLGRQVPLTYPLGSPHQLPPNIQSFMTSIGPRLVKCQCQRSNSIFLTPIHAKSRTAFIPTQLYQYRQIIINPSSKGIVDIYAATRERVRHI